MKLASASITQKFIFCITFLASIGVNSIASAPHKPLTIEQQKELQEILNLDQQLDENDTRAGTGDTNTQYLIRILNLLNQTAAAESSCCDITISDLDVIMSFEAQILSELEACCSTVNSKLDVIESELEACCSTINSKLDVIESDLEDCCFSVNSKLDIVINEEFIIDSQLEQCCATVNSKLDEIASDTDVLISLVEDIVACGAIPVTGPTTINTPGLYCVADNFDGNITINSSDVYLDLNGHTLSNGTASEDIITINPTLNNIKIYNGSLNGLSTTNGINILNSSSQITIEDVIINACFDGVAADYNCTLITLNNCQINGCVDDGIHFVPTLASATITNCLISNCQITNSANYGIDLSGCVNIITQNSQILGNNVGIVVTSASDLAPSNDCKVLNCAISQNQSYGIQILNNTVASSFLNNLVTENGSDGINVNNSVGTGGNDFSNNRLTNNVGFGINNNVASIGNNFFGNYACENLAGEYNNVDFQKDLTNANLYNNVTCDNTGTDEIIEVLSKIDEVESILENCCFSLNSKLDVIINEDFTVESQVDQCCFTINSKLDMLSECGATPVILGDNCASAVIFTITVPGTYCLSQHNYGQIIINSDDVILDLNGHALIYDSTISNIITVGEVNNVIIKNGTVSGDCPATSDAVGDGIHISSNASDITIDQVTVLSVAGNGIFVDNTNARLNILNSIIKNTGVDGIALAGIDGSLITDAIIYNTSVTNAAHNGINVSFGQNVCIKEIVASHNAWDGVIFSDCLSCKLLQSKLSFNGQLDNASVPTGGFELAGDCADCSILQNLITDNKNVNPAINPLAFGISITNSIGFNDVSNNRLTNNGVYGIVRQVVVPSDRFFGNYACGHTITDYQGITFQKGIGSANTYYNVSCSTASQMDELDTILSKIDEVESILENCCFTLNSKVDVISTNVNTIESVLDDCCFSINSKVDEVIVDVALIPTIQSTLDECCFSVNSKLDAVISSQAMITTVQSTLDECCFTLNSKVDDITSSITTDDFTTQSKLDSLELCCASLTSLVNTCCFTLNSKLDLLITRTF